MANSNNDKLLSSLYSYQVTMQVIYHVYSHSCMDSYQITQLPR